MEFEKQGRTTNTHIATVDPNSTRMNVILLDKDNQFYAAAVGATKQHFRT